MQAGELDNLITIEQPSDPPPRTASGAVNKADPNYWQAYGDRWAKDEPQGGREFLKAHAVYSEMTHMLTLRIDSGITNRMRVLLDGVALDIIAARHWPRQPEAMTILICKEGRSQGS